MNRLHTPYASTPSLLTLAFLLLQIQFASAQLNEPTAFGSTCSEAPLLCGDFLENYSGTNATSLNDSIGNNPTNCTIDNAVWLAIPVCETTLAFDISVTNCSNPSGGLEIFLLDSTDCENYNFVSSDCEIVANGNTNSVSIDGLDGASIYYLLIDGIDGDICEFNISNLSGVLAETGQEPIDTAGLLSIIQLEEGTITGPECICPGEEATYTFTPGTCQTTPCIYNGSDPVQGVPADCEIPGVCVSTSSDTTVVNWGFPDSVIVANDDSMSFDITITFDLEYFLNYYNGNIPTSGSDTIPFLLTADLETIPNDSLATNNTYCDCPGNGICENTCDRGATGGGEVKVDFDEVVFWVCEFDFACFNTPNGQICNGESTIVLEDCLITTYRVEEYPPFFSTYSEEVCPGECASGVPPFGLNYCPGIYFEIDFQTCEEWFIEITESSPTNIDLGVEEICEGSSYSSPIGPLGAGSHNWDSIDPSTGCNNITSITIIEVPFTIVNLPDETICPGALFNSPNGPLPSGSHSWTELDIITGCDIQYNLTILEFNVNNINLGIEEICAGSTYPSPIGPLSAGNHSWPSTDPFNGCSNETIITIVELDPDIISISETVCSGEFYNSPIGQLSAGIHTGQSIDVNTGCLATFNITIDEYVVTDIDLGLVEICPEETYPSPIGPLESGSYSWPSVDPSNGCENITTITVQDYIVNINNYGDFTVCEGDCLDYNGETFCTPGIHTFPETSINGCMTEGQLNLIIVPIEINNIGTVDLCPEECYPTPDGDLCDAGTYTWNTLNTSTGCPIENTVTLNIVVPQDSFLGVFEICPEECFPINDSLYCEEGLHSFPSVDVNGCLGTTSFELLILPTDTTYMDPFYVCEGDCIEPFPGWIICDEGVSEISITALSGCPEVFIIELNVTPYEEVSTGPITEICDGLGEGFTISFDIQGTAPFLINGDSLLDNFYTSEYIPTDSSYFYEIKTTALCTEEVIVSGDYTCPLFEYPSQKYYIPNAFSPNNDDVNDFFEILGSEELVKIDNLSVFDRWGKVVFSVDNYQPGDLIGKWNGQSRKGQRLNSGVFIYKAQLAFSDGTREQAYGEVTLLR